MTQKFSIPAAIEEDIRLKFPMIDLADRDEFRAIAIYAHHITTVILECVSPARGHKARKKRIYDAVDARQLELQFDWVRDAGFSLSEKEPFIGAWEIAGGMNEGLFTDQFNAQPEDLKPLLLRVGEVLQVSFGQTEALMVRASEDWTVMDSYNDAALACYDQLKS